MPPYGIFEDDVLITGAYTDLGTAEDAKDRLKNDPGMVYGNLEALELCSEHQVHAFGACHPGQAEDTELLARVLNRLEAL